MVNWMEQGYDYENLGKLQFDKLSLLFCFAFTLQRSKDYNFYVFELIEKALEICWQASLTIQKIVKPWPQTFSP